MTAADGRTDASGMTAERVLELLDALRSVGLDAWVDGGWGVDALVGRETRPHDDLDLVVALTDVPKIETCLGSFGFSIAEDHRPVRVVMRDGEGAQLDLHTVTFDAQGGGLQPQPHGGTFCYPAEGIVRGRIGGRAVACVSAEVQILCHLGYEPSGRNVHDVLLLCRCFGIPVPPAYESFRQDS